MAKTNGKGQLKNESAAASGNDQVESINVGPGIQNVKSKHKQIFPLIPLPSARDRFKASKRETAQKRLEHIRTLYSAFKKAKLRPPPFVSNAIEIFGKTEKGKNFGSEKAL